MPHCSSTRCPAKTDEEEHPLMCHSHWRHFKKKPKGEGVGRVQGVTKLRLYFETVSHVWRPIWDRPIRARAAVQRPANDTRLGTKQSDTLTGCSPRWHNSDEANSSTFGRYRLPARGASLPCLGAALSLHTPLALADASHSPVSMLARG